MHRLRAAVVLGFLGSMAWAGDDNAVLRENIVKNMLKAMGGITKILETVQDEGSARAAKGELKKAADAWISLRKKAEKMPPPSKMEADRLANLYKARLEESQKQLFAQIIRVREVPGGPEALGDLAKAFAPEKKGP